MERSSAVASDARPELDRRDLLADAGGNCDARRLHAAASSAGYWTLQGPLLGGSGAQHGAPAWSISACSLTACSFSTCCTSSLLITIRVKVSVNTLLNSLPWAPSPTGNRDGIASGAADCLATASASSLTPGGSSVGIWAPVAGKNASCVNVLI